MSKPIPYMQFYVADYMADTTHLTTEQHGAYDLILWNYWQQQKAQDESKLAKITKLGDEKWAENKDILAEFFDILDGKWSHKRIEIELKKVRDQARKNRAAGKKSGESRRAKKAEAEQALNARSTDDEQTVKQSYVKDELAAQPVHIAKKRLEKSERVLLLARGRVWKLEKAIQAQADVIGGST